MKKIQSVLAILAALMAVFSVVSSAGAGEVSGPTVEFLDVVETAQNGILVPGGIQPVYTQKFKTNFTAPWNYEVVRIDGEVGNIDSIVISDAFGNIIAEQGVVYDADLGKKVGGEMTIYFFQNPQSFLAQKVETHVISVRASYEAFDHIGTTVTVTPVVVGSFDLYEGVTHNGVFHSGAVLTSSVDMVPDAGGFSVQATGDAVDAKLTKKGLLASSFVVNWGNMSSVPKVFVYEVKVSSEKWCADQLMGLDLRTFGGTVVAKVQKIYVTGPSTALVRFVATTNIVIPPTGKTFGVYGAPGSKLSKNNISLMSIPAKWEVWNLEGTARIRPDVTIDVYTTISR